MAVVIIIIINNIADRVRSGRKDFFLKKSSLKILEASTSCDILVKLQLAFVWQKARKTLTNPCNNFNKSI